MKLNDITFFCDKKPLAVHISIDKGDSIWPVTVKINSDKLNEHGVPRITIFMDHAALLDMVESFQKSFDAYCIEKEGVQDND